MAGGEEKEAYGEIQQDMRGEECVSNTVDDGEAGLYKTSVDDNIGSQCEDGEGGGEEIGERA